jgi:hypothetical protein
MRGQQELHDAQARLGPHGGKHVRVPYDSLSVVSGFHISIIPEIANASSGFRPRVGAIWNESPFEAAVIPAKAGIQSVANVFAWG